MKQMYYCNKPCTVLHRMDNESIIEIDVAAMYTDEYHETGYIEPVMNTIIVENRYISDRYIDLETEFREKQAEISKIKREAEAEIRNQKNEAEKFIKNIEKKAKEYEGLNQWILYLEGKLNYYVIHSAYSGHSIRIVSKEEIDKREGDRYDREPRAFIFRATKDYYYRKKKEVQMFLNRYSDWSGHSADPISGFETIEEAKQFFISLLDQEDTKVDRGTAEAAKAHGLTHHKIDQFIADQEKSKMEARAKEIAEAQKTLERLKA